MRGMLLRASNVCHRPSRSSRGLTRPTPTPGGRGRSRRSPAPGSSRAAGSQSAATPRGRARRAGRTAGHDEAHDLVGQRPDRDLGGVGLDDVGGPREDELRLVGDVRRAGLEREALAVIAVVVDVAVMLGRRVPPLAADRQARLEVRRDLHDRRRRLHRLEAEVTSDRERECFHVFLEDGTSQSRRLRRHAPLRCRTRRPPRRTPPSGASARASAPCSRRATAPRP